MNLERRLFAASAFTLGVYALYVLAGKAASVWKLALPWEFGDVGEFLVVLGAMVLFVIGLMLREAREQPQGKTSE